MFNQFFRYLPIIKIIQKEKLRSVLDVGCGFRGIGRFWKRPFTGVDIEFKEKPIENMTPISGSVMNLPFLDSSFDCVVASDVLEHLPSNNRRKAIKEIIRVARSKAIIGVPYGKKSLETDKRLYDCYKTNDLSIPDWLEEHLKYSYPTYNQVVKALREEGYPFEVINNANIKIYFWIVWLEDSNRYWRKIFYVLVGRQRKLAEILVSFLNFGRPYGKIFIVSKK